MKKVVIMMATYNGEDYLNEQLKSLQAQTFSNWDLYVSDDSSNDNTVAILEKFQKKDIRLKKILFNKIYHGPFANYFNVMHYVKENCKNMYDYFFYCDQDDVWDKKKIELQIKALEKLEKKYDDTPCFCYSDLEICNKDLIDTYDRISNHITVQFIDNPYNEFFKEQYVWGTAMAHNKELWNLIPIEDVKTVRNYISHDSYIARMAAIYAHISYVNMPLVMYRRTGDNVTSTPHDYTFVQAVHRITTKLSFLINESARTYRVSLYTVDKARKKTNFVIDLRKCLQGSSIDSIKFFRKYNILKNEKFWGNVSTKSILYSGIYKHTTNFRRIIK